MGFVDLFQSGATLAFVLGSALVSARLIGLARRTRQLPELLLGAAVGCTAVLGYGAMILAMALAGGSELERSPLAGAVNEIGRGLHAVGVTLFLGFVLRVFRPREPWARGLALALAASLWTGLAAAAAAPKGFAQEQVGSWFWWAEYAVIWSYPLWGTTEAFRYWVLMNRRVKLGLATPEVAERFFLWGLAHAFLGAAVWISSLPLAMSGDAQQVAAATPAIRIATALAGLVSVTCSLFAFLPPRWYRARVQAKASLAPARA
jgi:hypothetical protein